MKQPWQQPPLSDWSIVGMNHYHVNGERFLFVSMQKDGRCITEEGKDDKYLWNRLWHKAEAIESPPTGSFEWASRAEMDLDEEPPTGEDVDNE